MPALPHPTKEMLEAGGRIIREAAEDIVDGWPFEDCDHALRVWNAMAEAYSDDASSSSSPPTPSAESVNGGSSSSSSSNSGAGPVSP